MKLVVLDGPMRGEEFGLERSPTVLGRDPGADVCLALDPHTALLHCRILREHGQYWLEDLGAGGGTRVYGRPKAPRVPLFERDVFRVGHTRLSVVDDAVDAETAVKELTRATVGPLDRLAPHAPPATAAAGSSVEPVAPERSAPAGERGERTAARERKAPPVAARAAGGPPAEATRERPGKAGATPPVAEAREGAIPPGLLGSLATASSVKQLLALALDHLASPVAAETALAFRLEAGIAVPEPLVERREPPERTDVAADLRYRDAAFARAIHEKRTIVITDAQTAEGHHELPVLLSDLAPDAAPGDLAALLCVPLVVRGEVRAILELESTRAGIFGTESVEEANRLRPVLEALLGSRLEAEDLRRVQRELQVSQDAIVLSETLAVAERLSRWVAAEVEAALLAVAPVGAPASDTAEELRVRLYLLLQELAAMVPAQGGEPRAIDLNDVVRGALAHVEPRANRAGVHVETELAASLPSLTGDPRRLLQAVAMLLDDAVRASADAGKRVRIRTAADADRITLAVSDTGVPLPDSSRALAFRPLFPVRPGGQGPGLHAVRRIVEEEHGGEIVMLDERGFGNSFELRFLRRTTVLVVDDDPDFLVLIRMRLMDRRYIVLTASDGEQALERIQARAPDIVITDVRMPRMDGFSLVEHLRSTPHLALLPVIFFTSLAERETRTRGFQIGADDFLTKDEVGELEGRIASALVRRERIETALRSRADSPGQATPGVRGTLDQMGIASLLTILEMDRRTGTLIVSRLAAAGSARLLLREGRVVSARVEGREAPRNAEVVYALLEWPDGQFEFQPSAVEVADEVNEDMSHLLMEGAKRQDDRRRFAGGPPA